MRRTRVVVLLLGLVALAPMLAGCGGNDDDFFGLNEKKRLAGERKELFPGGVPGVTQGLPAEYRGQKPKPAVAQKPAPDQKSADDETPNAFRANTADGVPYPETKTSEGEAATPDADAAAPVTAVTAAPVPGPGGAAPAQSGKMAAAEPEPKPKAVAKHKARQRTAKREPAKVTEPHAAQKQNAGRQQQTAPWPDQNQAQAQWPDLKKAQAAKPEQKQAQSTTAPQDKSMSSLSPWPAAPPSGTFSR
jgi:hypothetical protein